VRWVWHSRPAVDDQECMTLTIIEHASPDFISVQSLLLRERWQAAARGPSPRRAAQVLKICAEDTVLTLTSGGCNALNLLLHGAGRVVAVDCNPAQSALLELKATAIRRAARPPLARRARTAAARPAPRQHAR